MVMWLVDMLVYLWVGMSGYLSVGVLVEMMEILWEMILVGKLVGKLVAGLAAQ